MKHKALGYILLGLILAAIVSVTLVYQLRRSIRVTPVVHQTKMQTFTDSDKQFEFKYSNEYILRTSQSTGGTGQPDYFDQQDHAATIQVVAVYIPNTVFPGTNFAESYVAVAKDLAVNNAADCKRYSNGASTEQTTNKTENINGIAFDKAEFSGAGAGNFYETRLYRVFHGGVCYEISLTLHTTNIGNYEPGTVTEVNKGQAWSKLVEILNTFKFTNSNAAQSSNTKTYTDSKYGFSFEYPKEVVVGTTAPNSSLGTAQVSVPGIYVGDYVFVVATSSEMRSEAELYITPLMDAVKDPKGSEEGPSIICDTHKVNNTVKIELVECNGEGGPAVYGIIKGTSFDIFIDGYSKGWDSMANSSKLKRLSIPQLVEILETFKF